MNLPTQLRFALVATALCASPVFADRIPVLVLTGENPNAWRWTSTYLRQVLEDSGKFRVELSLYPGADLTDASLLSRYELVVVDYAGPRWGPVAEENFLEAVRGGTGVLLLHRAADTFPDWDAWSDVTGCTWAEDKREDFHQPVDIQIVEREHAVTSELKAWSGHSDSLLQGAQVAEDRQVLITASLFPGSPDTLPVVWAGKVGEGRVLTATLGHIADASLPVERAAPTPARFLIAAAEWAATGEVTPLRRIEPNTLTEADRAAGWRLLFDGSSTSGWKAFEGAGFPEDRWVVRNGHLVVLPGEDGGDILSAQEFDTFELELEWRADEGAESGVAIGMHGDGHPHDDRDFGSVASVDARSILRPPGEFNHVRVLARHDRVEHWLNGVRILTLYTYAGDWAQRVSGKNLARDPELGQLPLARISLQHTGTAVSFRNIKLRPLLREQQAGPVAASAPQPIELFNGKDLSGWRWVPQVDGGASPAFVARDGLLICRQLPVGYLRSEAEFTDYLLELDWRFNPQSRQVGDGGIMVGAVGEDNPGTRIKRRSGLWPRGIEVKLANRSAGDLWSWDWPVQAQGDRTRGQITRKIHDMEHQPGEWNHLQVRLERGLLTVTVNGEVVNSAQVEPTTGNVVLMAEAADIEYANLRLTPLE